MPDRKATNLFRSQRVIIYKSLSSSFVSQATVAATAAPATTTGVVISVGRMRNDDCVLYVCVRLCVFTGIGFAMPEKKTFLCPHSHTVRAISRKFICSLLSLAFLDSFFLVPLLLGGPKKKSCNRAVLVVVVAIYQDFAFVASTNGTRTNDTSLNRTFTHRHTYNHIHSSQ